MPRISISLRGIFFPLGLRLQMASCYTAAFAMLLLLTGGGFYVYLEDSLEASVDADLHIRAQQIASSIGIGQGTVTLHTAIGNLTGFDRGIPEQVTQAADVNDGTLVRLVDAHGTLFGETPAFRSLHVPEDSWLQPLQGRPWQGTVLSTRDQEIRLYSCVLHKRGQPLVVIQVGVSLANLHTLLRHLVTALLIVGSLVLLVCTMGSYWLAGRSLAPIQRLAETARRIKAGDLHQRVPVPSACDEVHYLAMTLNEMLASLEQSFARQRQFVADASHELRTPVAVIRNKAGVALLEPPRLDEALTALQEIRTETERLSLLLTDLLTLARGDEGQIPLAREAIQVDRLVATVATAVEVLAVQREIELTVQASYPITVVGDEARLIQVVWNLLDNAIRFTNPGGHIWLSVEQTRANVSLIVRDTGVGIEPEHLPHIFERFYRADPARKHTASSSSGLGLSIVEWIVHAHGGSITVESQVGWGSCFAAHLPKQRLEHS